MSKIIEVDCDHCEGTGNQYSSYQATYPPNMMDCEICGGSGIIDTVVLDGLERAIERLKDVRENASNNKT